MIGRGDDDGVESALVEHVVEMAEDLRLLAGSLLDQLQRALAVAVPEVADGRQLGALLLAHLEETVENGAAAPARRTRSQISLIVSNFGSSTTRHDGWARKS